jgi:hypothetical protein
MTRGAFSDASKLAISRARGGGPVVRRSMADGSEFEYSHVGAVAADGFSTAHVCNCLSGKLRSHKGFYWRKAGEPFIEPADMRGKTRGRPLLLTPPDSGETLRFERFSDAVAYLESLGKTVDPGRAYRALKKEYGCYSAYGFLWDYADVPPVDRPKRRSGASCGEEGGIRGIGPDGHVITVPRVADVAQHGFHPQHVSDCLSGVRRHHKGYVWSRTTAAPPPLYEGRKDKRSRRIGAQAPDGRSVEFDSMAAVAAAGFVRDNVRRAILGELKHVKGYTNWRFLDK